jgi:predicted metalloprotease with PDZ domain
MIKAHRSSRTGFAPLIPFFLIHFFCLAGLAQSQPILLNVDASEAPNNIIHVSETIRVKPGPLTLFYPKWIPGEHTPTGTISDMTNFFIKAAGKPLVWKRDDVEMFAFRCDIPEGVTEIEVTFDDAMQSDTLMSEETGRIKWNRLFLYPQGASSDGTKIAASLKPPLNWKYATALASGREAAGWVYFREVSLTRLVDSPAIIGEYFKKVPLSGGPVTHEIDMVGDTEDSLEASAETIAGWKNLVREAGLLFGAHHYNSYRFLLTISDVGQDEGLEHHESSEDGAGETTFKDENRMIELSDLLGHEFAHSWNGKYRRPAGLVTSNFEQPMRGDLLWVYEGLTQYLGFVLPSRSKLWTPETFRETVAMTAADMDHQAGRKWRPLVDTARAVQLTYSGPGQWTNARRGADYYDEGMLIWMEADVVIREKSKGRLSLDDFCRKFYGGQNTGPVVKPYDLDEVVTTLNSVVTYDWRGFFDSRVYSINPRAPVDGISGGGWKLVYDDTPNTRIAGDEELRDYTNLVYSLGFQVDKYGYIFDVNPDLAAARAGISPGVKITKINGAEFSSESIANAVANAKTGSDPIVFDVEGSNFTRTVNLDYHDGRRYPHLVRDMTKPDLLSDIIKSH